MLPPVPMISSRKENVHRHVLRLLLHLHARVAPSKLEALQKALEPTGQVGYHQFRLRGHSSVNVLGQSSCGTMPLVLTLMVFFMIGLVYGFTPSCRLRQTTCPMACPCLVFPQSGEAVKELYSQLGEKLEQLDHRKSSPTQAAETPALDLPLPSVPAPAAL